jgi:hypothetical protein
MKSVDSGFYSLSYLVFFFMLFFDLCDEFFKGPNLSSSKISEGLLELIDFWELFLLMDISLRLLASLVLKKDFKGLRV